MPVTLADGKSKQAGLLTVEDRVLAVNPAGKRVPAQVRNLKLSRQPCLQIRHARGVIRCSQSHLLRTSEGMNVAASNLQTDDILVMEDGEGSPILAIESIGEQEVVRVDIPRNMNMFAAGVEQPGGTAKTEPIEDGPEV